MEADTERRDPVDLVIDEPGIRAGHGLFLEPYIANKNKIDQYCEQGDPFNQCNVPLCSKPAKQATN